MRTIFAVFQRFSRRFTGPVLLAGLTLAVGCRPSGEVSDGVELVPSSDPLTAATSFEVRFDHPLVAPDVIGRTNVALPITTQPRLAGSFLWTSQRGGTFTPAEPLALGTAYTFSLRGGLQGLDGQAVAARLHRTVSTPAFSLTEVAGVPREGDCPASLTLRMLFNAAVSAERAAPCLEFRSDDGQRIQATVTQGRLTDRRWGFSGSRKDHLSWEEWFAEAHATNTVTQQFNELTNPAPNVLLVSPSAPLLPCRNWTLVVGAALPMAGGGETLGKRQEFVLGVVQPFRVVEVTAHNYINHGRSIRIEFSKGLPLALATTYADWITVSPPVSNLTADVWGARIALHGDFPLQGSVEVSVRSGLPSNEGLKLGEDYTTEVSVEPIPPRLYFPAVETGQYASGRRTFPLLVMNLDRVRVRAKRLDDASAIHGLRGFGRVYEPNYYPRDKEFYEVDYELVPGYTVYDETFGGTTEVDEAATIQLDWDRILGPGTNGAVFLCAERAPSDDKSDNMVLPSKHPPQRKPVAVPPPTPGLMPPPPVVPQAPTPGYRIAPPVGLGVEAMVQVTDLGLVWKTAGGEMLVFVFSLQTGQPVPAATVALFTDENQPLSKALTDDQGLAKLSLSTNAVWLMARTSTDTCALEWQRSPLPLWSFNLPRSYRDDRTDDRIIELFSDRDLYRPGETIHFKGVVREWSNDALAPCATNVGVLSLRDYRDTASLNTNVTLSPYGTFEFSFALPPDARQGLYSAEVKFGEAATWVSLHVLDSRPRSFETKIGARSAYAAGDQIAIPVSAKYLFGKPLESANLRWTIEFQDEPPTVEGFDGFCFTRSWRDASLGRGPASGTLTGQAQLGGTNLAVITPELGTNVLCPQPRRATLAVEITDQNQQTLTDYAVFVRHSSDFYLGVHCPSSVVQASTTVKPEAVAIMPDGAPCTNRTPVTLRLFRMDWQASRVIGAGNVASYRSEAVLTNLLTREFTLEPARRLPHGEWQAANVPEFKVEEAGDYLLELSATDAAGHAVVCSAELSAFASKEKLAWNYRNEVEIELLPDQPVYAPGDTATLLLKTPLSGTALVTVERANVRRAFVTRLEGNAPSVRVPILAGDAPNVGVLVTLLRGAADSTGTVKEPEYRIGARNLVVEDPARRLRVTITPSATNYLPAAPVEIEAQVRDSTGAPVRDAEVTLYAVDEGVLLMSGYKLPDLYSAFYNSRPIRVDSGISLPLLLPEDPTQLHFSNKGYQAGGGGQEQIRKHFAACAFWNASLITDAAGMVRARFPAPDAITRYRVLAVALTRQNEFGGAEKPFSVSKPLLVEPALPAFARRTDQLVARAVVLNQTETAGEVEVSLALDATATSPTNLTQRVSVAPRGSAVVEFPVNFQATGTARWVWRGRFSGPNAPAFTDAVQSILEVLPPAPLLTERLSITALGPTNLLARANPQMLRGDGSLTVTLANSRLVGLADAVPHLLHYPYGCAEQTASTLLPWLVLRATPTLAPLVNSSTNTADAAIRHGLRRLLDMRTTGGISYWPDGQKPMPWASAYGTLVLALAQENGVELPDGSLDGLTDGLSAGLPASFSNRVEIATGCLALYALAAGGKAEAAWHEQFFGQRARLSGEARSLLALAISLADGPDEMVETLLREKPPTDAPELMFYSPRREQAIRLLAWVKFKAEAPEVEPLVESLVARLAEHAGLTTQDAAWTLLALSAYAEACEDELPPTSGSLAWHGTNAAFQLSESNRLVRFHFKRTTDELTPRMELDVPAGTRLFTHVTLATVPPENQQAAQDHGLKVTRTYTALGATNQPVDLANLRVGDRVLVTLRVIAPRDCEFLALDDPLPSVLEAELPEFRPLPGVTLPFADDADGFGDFRELRADRALFFADDLAAGRYVVRYLARVRAAGTTTAPAVRAEAMYAPDQFGLSDSQVLQARPAKD